MRGAPAEGCEHRNRDPDKKEPEGVHAASK
jgi:hypothetical protein